LLKSGSGTWWWKWKSAFLPTAPLNQIPRKLTDAASAMSYVETFLNGGSKNKANVSIVSEERSKAICESIG